jgi:hypothetical protein
MESPERHTIDYINSILGYRPCYTSYSKPCG